MDKKDFQIGPFILMSGIIKPLGYKNYFFQFHTFSDVCYPGERMTLLEKNAQAQ